MLPVGFKDLTPRHIQGYPYEHRIFVNGNGTAKYLVVENNLVSTPNREIILSNGFPEKRIGDILYLPKDEEFVAVGRYIDSWGMAEIFDIIFCTSNYTQVN